MKDNFIEKILQKTKINAVILASGRGSNARALFEYIASDDNLKSSHSWNLNGILSDNENAPVLQFAKENNIPSFYIPYSKDKNIPLSDRRKDHNHRLIEKIKSLNTEIDFVFCAGYMKVLTKDFLDFFHDKEDDVYRVINIHPSLLPSFPGVNGYRDAFNYGVKKSGVTVHFVDEKIDHGTIIDQAVFERMDDDDLNSFSARGLEKEHILYVDVIKKLQNNKYLIKNTENNRKYISYR